MLSPRLVLLTFAFAAALGAAEVNSLMVAPPKPVTGKIEPPPPTPPGEAAKTFRVLDGFRMELVAAEPLVASPVAMAYDENGRAFVCEMRDYPYTDKARHVPGQENPTDAAIGRIRLLEDLDGDGVFEKSTVFADGLSWPTGVACWQGGIFVAATPDIWYLKDTDGDGKADVRRKVFTGFKKLNVQALINNLVWGLDNRIYGAGGTNGGQIRPADEPAAKPLVMSRHDFRFDPVSAKFELVSGGARFGGTFDDWGSRFLCNIRNPAQHILLPLNYLARNPALAAGSAIHDMAVAGDQLPVYAVSPPESWRVIRAKRWAGERDIVMPRSELVGAGVVTSAGGITSYRGAAYPESYRDTLFVTESASNLFYRLKLTPSGATFKAERIDGKAEMVASTDNWFRPVNFVNAPDGTLHVMDMYRGNIEHPWSIPDDIHAAVDLEAGRDMGRIWRLAPPKFTAPKPPQLGRANAAELVATLEHPSAWWRETAQRLLFERQDQAAVPALHALVRGGKTALGRLHALWSLHGLGALTDDDVRRGLGDTAAGVRENAVKLAEQRGLFAAVWPLADDASARVRLQTAFTLGGTADPRALDALATIARRDAGEPWIRTAVLSSTGQTSDALLVRLLGEREFAASEAAAELLRSLAQVVGVRGKVPEMQRVLAACGAAGKSPAVNLVVGGIGEGLKRAGKSLRRGGFTGEAATVADAVLAAAVREATETGRPAAVRGAAIRLLAFDDFDRVKAPLAGLLVASQPQDVQRAAVAALGSFTAPETAALLLANWSTQTPAVRADVVTAMLAARVRVLPLVQAVERGVVPASQIPFDKRRLLLRNVDPAVKALATKYFADDAPRPRRAVIENYRPALELKGEAARGRKVFEAVCAACHRAGEVGTSELGPNLATIRAWNPDQVLINTLDPNREVAPAYLNYTVETKDGRTVSGLIATENEASVTLKRADGGTETVLRRDIATLTGSGQSLMPEGLESAVSPEAMADLIAFLLAAP